MAPIRLLDALDERSRNSKKGWRKMANNRGSRLALRAGVSCGLAVGSLTIVQFTLALLGANMGTLQEIGDVFILGGFMAFFLLGLIARRQTGSVAIGVRAGLIAAVVASLVAGVSAIVLAGVAPDVYAQVAAQMTPASVGVGPALVVSILTSIVEAGVGFGLAMAGALSERPRTAEPVAR